MKILQVITDTNRRGAQVFAGYLGDELGREGHEVDTVALRRGEPPGTIDQPVLADSRLGGRMLLRLRRLMALSDLAIAHGSSTLPACAAAGLGAGRRFVYRQISDPEVWAATPTRRLRSRVALSRSAHVVALSDRNRTQLQRHLGVDPRRCTVIPNAAPAARFSPAGPVEQARARRTLGLREAPTVLFVGSLSWEKSPATAIQTIAQTPAAQLVVAGDGPQRSMMEELAREIAPGRAVFVGAVVDASTLYSAADALILTSRTEAAPGVLIEAALSGLPVVAANVGAVAEIVRHQQTGLLVDSDRPEDYAAAIDRLLHETDLGRRLGDHAHRRALERFEIGPVARSWSSLLQQVAGGHR